MNTENFRACREFGISARVGYKWRDRFMAEGLAGMDDQSRRRHGCPRRLSEKEICAMVRIKERHRHWGAQKIREVYLRQHGQAPSESSFKRVLEALWVNGKAQGESCQADWTDCQRGARRAHRTRCGRWSLKAGGTIGRADASR